MQPVFQTRSHSPVLKLTSLVGLIKQAQCFDNVTEQLCKANWSTIDSFFLSHSNVQLT